MLIITFIIYYFRLPINKPEPVIKHDNEAQTELHPIPSHIDPTYHWNEWDLKRDAIKLVSEQLLGAQCICNKTAVFIPILEAMKLQNKKCRQTRMLTDTRARRHAHTRSTYT